MPSVKIYFCFVMSVLLQMNADAQRAVYSDSSIGYEVRIAGRIGNSIHVWSSSARSSRFYLKNTILTLHIFSADMHLKEEKQIELGAIKTWDADFQFDDTCYYANIVSSPDLTKRLLLKVDQYGNMTDVTGTPDLWKKQRAVSEATWEQTVVQKGSFAFAAKVENYNMDEGATNNTTLLPGTNIQDAADFKKLVIRKRNIQNGETTQHTYASAGTSFFYPLLQVSDTGVFVCAFTEPPVNLIFNKLSRGVFMFFARLDSNLTESGNGHVLLKNKKLAGTETYLPKSIFPSEKGFFIVSIGQYQDPDEYSWPTTSLRVTQIDERNNLVRDTIIKDQRGQPPIQWDNVYVADAGNGIDIFYTVPYSPYKSGIAHLNISSNGKIKEKDMVVEGHYEYLLPAAKKISAGVLLVPFTHNGKTALLKLAYD